MAEDARDFNAATRKRLAKSGDAMPDGSFPIQNAGDLKNAIRLAGNAKNPAAAKAHIKKRAAALGLTKNLPDSWKSQGANSDSEGKIPNKREMSTKELHDRWMDLMPEGAVHDPDDCVLCQLVVEDASKVGDSMAEKDYTEEDVKAAVAAAVKPLEDRLGELEGAKAEEAIEAKIAEARVELETKVADLQKDLDVKVAEVTAAKQEIEDINAYLKAENDAATEEAAREARKTERLDQVKENANYPDEYLATHADRWSAWSDEEFAGFIDDLKAAGVTKGESSKKDEKLPPETKLSTSRETSSHESTSALSGLLEMRAAGIDARRI